jgi:Nucleotidyl transferase AbiEii toxin, Type IV TA system
MAMFQTHVLPEPQITLWQQMHDLPPIFTLYGGTAVALRLGHRTSVDFDFFTSEAIDDPTKQSLISTLPWLAGCMVLQNRPQTLTVSTESGGAPVKVSFFGGIATGRVAEPERDPMNSVPVASLADLLAHKLKCLHDRAEGKDYQDIAAILLSGIDLAQGIADRIALFGDSVPAMETAKALVWFNDIGEAWRLPEESRTILRDAVAGLPALLPPAKLVSTKLS